MITKDNLPSGGWHKFRKRELTLMRRMDGPFTVMTKEGPLSCPDGWLAVDGSGYPYPVATEDQLVYDLVIGESATK